MPEIKKFTASGTSKLSPTDVTKRKEVPVARYFGQQIQFKNSMGLPLKDVRYSLRIDTGAWIDGVTDRFGKTRRILTPTSQAITQAKLKPHVAALSCNCTEDERDWLALTLHNVKTTRECVDSSFIEILTPKGDSRPLTSGERKMARVLFKDAVDYDKVQVHNDEFLWFGLQPNDTAMTPNGHIYYGKAEFREDFSLVRNAAEIQVFIHEMVHVWQHQLGYPVMARGANRLTLHYEYEIHPFNTLSDYNMEQQGDLLSDYWAYMWFGPRPLVIKNKTQKNLTLAHYQKVLSSFIANPASKDNLPSWKLDRFKEGRTKI